MIIEQLHTKTEEETNTVSYVKTQSTTKQTTLVQVVQPWVVHTTLYTIPAHNPLACIINQKGQQISIRMGQDEINEEGQG